MLGVLIVDVDVIPDGHDRRFEVLEDASANGSMCDVAKEEFYHVEP